MHHTLRRHTISFKHAVSGIRHAFNSQPNFRIHCLLAVAAITVGFWLDISFVEWAILSLTIIWVLLTEMVNTAIESMVDLITTEYRQEAKVAKDVAAGAVLMGAIGAVAIAFLIFLPKIIARGI